MCKRNQYLQFLKLLISTCLIVLLIDSNWHAAWGQNQSSSGFGVIAYPTADKNRQLAVNIREEPPKISPLGFKLGEKICTVTSGTEFDYSEVVKTINNQIWYRVTIYNPLELGQPPCPRPLQGWILAQQSDGENLVADFLTEPEVQTDNAGFDNIENLEQESEIATINPSDVTDEPIDTETEAQSQPDDIQSDSEPEVAESSNSSSDAPFRDISPDQRPTEKPSNSTITEDQKSQPEKVAARTIVKSDEEDNKWQTFSNYFLVCLGSILGLLVITFEQACSNDEHSAGEIFASFKNRVVSLIFLIRLLVLMLASFGFISILSVISTDDDLLSTIQQLSLSHQGLYEPIIAGFLICIVILSFTSSSK